MTDAFDADRAQAIEAYIDRVKALNPEGARVIREKGIEVAREMGIAGGFLVIVGATKLQLASEAYGNARPSHVKVALAKTKTVLNYRMSSRGFGERMVEIGLTEKQLAGQVGSTAGGGVPVFADPECQTFIGAVAFSGGTTIQDEAVSVVAVERAGLYTKITPLPQGKEPLIPQQAPVPQQG